MRLFSLDFNYLDKKKSLLGIFLFSFILASFIFLPFIILDKGYFFYMGDYNSQQIPFNILANEAIKTGNIFWNWNTDLGANFIGSYAFYLLGSPFFMLQLLFPASWVPMVLPWLLCLKFAISGVTAFLYIDKFVKNKNYVFLAAILYAFSSFAIYNIFFNHFNDVIALFPLLLYAFEEFMEKDRRGIFAFTVFLSALTNYYFFVAQVIFLIIYFFVRLFHKAWPKFNFKKFLFLVFESVMGFSMAAFIVFPALLTTLQLPRADAKLTGWALITYYETQRPLQIIQAFFFPPEIPSRLSFFPNAGGKWSSVTAWLPLFGMVGTIAWINNHRKDWLARLISILIFMAFIPPLNASFQLLSRSFYTRWFFVLILMMALATARAIEDCTQKQFKKGIIWSIGFVSLLALPVNLIKDPKTGEVLAGNPTFVWIYFLISIFCILFTYMLIFKLKRESPKFFITSLIVLAVIITGIGNLSLASGRSRNSEQVKQYIQRNIYGREKIDLDDLDNIRIDVQNGDENSGMYWKIPSIHAFHSIVPGSIISFYQSLGMERNVASRPDTGKIGVRALLSVKYIFDGDNREDIESYGFFRIKDHNGFGVWENSNYIPYGFTYDYYIKRSNWDALDEHEKERILLRAIVLEDDDSDIYNNLLQEYVVSEYMDTSDVALSDDANMRAKNSAYEFSRDNMGFDASIITQKENLVFFSVPYEPGWSAKVNGKDARIIRSNIGFMAVKVPEGDNFIRFDFMTPGLKVGIITSSGSIIAILLYLFVFLKLNRNLKRKRIKS